MDTATDLVIVGAGAAGLMAAVAAGEAGLNAVLLEHKHRPGLKLLMCGNNRCNVTQDASADEMLDAYGPELRPFLTPALMALPPARLREWFARARLRTTVHDDGRVFPASENADDVLHCFTDRLRDLGVPLVLNCPVQQVSRDTNGFTVRCPRLTITGRTCLLCTGGVSYPKTGSVGDGQRFAKLLGHSIRPYRAGLAGIVPRERWLLGAQEESIQDARVTVSAAGALIGATAGEILLDRHCARGPAMVDASRLMAHAEAGQADLVVDVAPGLELTALSRELDRRLRAAGAHLDAVLTHWLLPPRVASGFCRHVVGEGSRDPLAMARCLKTWRWPGVTTRPLKEAMVTVGGVMREDIDAETMASRRCPGLYFAGEVMDVDGPTGGYNLHAAFATGRLAVAAVAAALGAALPAVEETGTDPPRRPRSRKRRQRRR